MDLRKVANVLDKAASYVEAVENEKREKDAQTRRAHVDKVASAHTSAHGEEIPEDVRDKLAATDPKVLSFVEGVLRKQAGVVEPLGRPDNGNDDAPTNVKEAADTAHERFGAWILS